MGICGSNNSNKQSTQIKYIDDHFKTKEKIMAEHKCGNFDKMMIPDANNQVLFDCSTEDVQKVYCFSATVIGKGHYGAVRMAKLKYKGRRYDDNPGKIFAVKTIDQQKLGDDLYLLNRELNILRNLDHPNIIKFFETYIEQKF